MHRTVAPPIVVAIVAIAAPLSASGINVVDVQPYAETRSIFDLDTDDPLLPPGGRHGDADDPSFWIPKDPTRTRIITALKDGGLDVYDLDGALLQQIAPDDIRYNNVNVLQDARVGHRRLDLAVASDRRNDLLAIFAIDETGSLATSATRTGRSSSPRRARGRMRRRRRMAWTSPWSSRGPSTCS